jgi:hypothetical protein
MGHTYSKLIRSTSKSRSKIESTSKHYLIPTTYDSSNPLSSSKKLASLVHADKPSSETHDNNDKRMTMMISTHGSELINTRLIRSTKDNKVRVFSLSGKLSVCSEYSDEKIREYDRYVKSHFAKELKNDNSTYKTIATLHNEFWKHYLDELRGGLKAREEMLEDLYDKKLNIDHKLSKKNKRIVYSEEDEDWYDHPDIVKINNEIDALHIEIMHSKRSIETTRQNQHGKNYVPVVDKIFYFPEEIDEHGGKTPFFIKVVHYDGERNKIIQHLDFTKIETVLPFFKVKKLHISEELLRIYKKDYEKNMIRLSTIIHIVRQAGFDIINLIDTSCRVFTSHAFTNYTHQINKIEKEEDATSMVKHMGGRSIRSLTTHNKTLKNRHKISRIM